MKRIVEIHYYKREGDDRVLKVTVMPWDEEGIAHFEKSGYTRKFPARDSK